MKAETATSEDLNALRNARGAIQAGRPDHAHQWLDPLVKAKPGLAEARHLLGALLRVEGDLAGAEREVRQAVKLAPDKAVYRVSLARVLLELGREVEAERELKAALRVAPGDETALSLLVPRLYARADWAELATVTEGASRLAPDIAEARVQALTALGREDEALATQRALVEAHPALGRAEHDLAVMLSNRGELAEAEDTARAAIAHGFDDPEAWLLAGRMAMRQGDLDKAEADFREALRRVPDHGSAHQDLAELVWMRTGDATAAMATFDKRLKEADTESLWWMKPRIMSFVGGPQAAADAAAEAAEHFPGHGSFAMLASQSAAEADRPEDALKFADAVWKQAPDSLPAHSAMLYATLCAGEADKAVVHAEAMRRLRNPNDQFAIAMLYTAWRLAGDPRAAELYDYDSLVRTYRLDTPEGWPSLEAFLADLKAALEAQHFYKTHPFSQSIRHGSQTMQGLLTSKDPAIAAFFATVSKSIDRHVRYLGKGRDVLRARNTGRWAFEGAWSVRLKRDGRHVDHVHPSGWLSSAFYVEAPRAAVEGQDRGGWIKFGEPGMITRPHLEPERFVKPEPGMLVLFPSYMWHGTVPFTTDESRLTVAFDMVPA
ncbi:MAG: tetratricopeptide repeat protein [Proteobacteria bacterium]|nr:tetratricopeptide repeat protein [Pseudomonadota bacterium]